MAKAKIIKSPVCRSADTGRFVTKKYVKKNPKTTVREIVRKEDEPKVLLDKNN